MLLCLGLWWWLCFFYPCLRRTCLFFIEGDTVLRALQRHLVNFLKKGLEGSYPLLLDLIIKRLVFKSWSKKNKKKTGLKKQSKEEKGKVKGEGWLTVQRKVNLDR